MSTYNDVSNVTAGKPNVTGAIYRAALTATAPTSAASTLDTSTFIPLGYISEDGVTNTNSPESDEVKAWGGDTVLNLQTAKSDKFKFTLIESLNTEVMKMVYGDDNVSGSDISTGYVITANADDLDEAMYVIDMAVKGDILKRIVIPDAKVSEIGDIIYQDGAAVGYEVTITALPDTSGNTHYEYLIEATE